MDYLSTLLDFEGKKKFKKDIHSEEINIEIYLERSIKWLGLFSLALAVITQLMNEASGTDMKCFPDREAGFAEPENWMKEQMDLSKAFGEYIDVHCATTMVDYGPLYPTVQAAKYTRADIDSLAKGTLHLPYRRCIVANNDIKYCECEAEWEDGGKNGPNTCNKTLAIVAPKPVATKPPTTKPSGPKPGPSKPVAPNRSARAAANVATPRSDIARFDNSEVKYREKMFHHYFAWYLLMQAIMVLLPQHIWNTLFSDRILRKLLKIHECALTPQSDKEQTPNSNMEKLGGQLMQTLQSIQNPMMTIVFIVKQVYYVCAGLYGWNVLHEYVGYGIQENQVTRCLMEEYAFLICASPANGSIWFVYVIDICVIWFIVLGAAANVVFLIVKWAMKAHLKKEFLKELLDKMFVDCPKTKEKLERLQSEGFSDYPFFSRLVQENKHIFGDIYVSLMSRNEIVADLEELEDDEIEDVVRKTVHYRANTKIATIMEE